MRVCIGLDGKGGCGAIIPRDARDGRCPTHQRQIRKQRGNPRARGRYDAEHRRTRARLLPAAVGKPCPVAGPTCAGLITRDNARLDHSTPLATDPTSRGDRIICDPCNSRLGGQQRHATRG